MARNDSKNSKTMLSYGIRLLHLNETGTFQKELRLLNRFHAEIGRRYRGIYFYSGLSINTFWYQHGPLHHHGLEIISGTWENLDYQMWLGYTFGLQLDI
ncbi:MAG: hypothetical protein JXQ96_22345 [Cyclobacteriaceae bacterium]